MAAQGYYATVNESSPTTLRQSLHAIIDDHQLFPYTSSSTDTWDILESADQDPANASRIVDVNRNLSIAKQGGGNPFYDRDHLWPRSYGFPVNNGNNYPFVDCHALMLSDSGYNGSRGNALYNDCDAGCSELVTVLTNGRGGGSGVYPGNSNWLRGSGASGTWEQWSDRKGDVARAMFYLDVRYEGGRHASGATEPDLILTDNVTQIAASATGQNESIAYFGLRLTLLAWHRQDPVDAAEMRRNDVVFGFQGNRNPFIDNPDWVECLFLGAPAQEVPRLGFPLNPLALGGGVTSVPVLGATWDPAIDHTAFMPGAVVDVLLISAVPVNVPSPFGTLLCDLSGALSLFSPPGTAFAIPLPASCALSGTAFCAQGASADGAGAVRLTNALDVTVGYQ